MHYGMNALKTGVAENGKVMIEDNGRSLPGLLGEAGYRTHAVGKCHFKPDRNALRGFQSRKTQEEVMSDPDKDDYLRWLKDNGYDYYEPHGARSELYSTAQVSSLPAEAHPTQWVADRSIEFIREASSANAPWMLFGSFIHPHPPVSPPKPWHRLYRGPLMPLPNLPPNYEALKTWINHVQNRSGFWDPGTSLHQARNFKAFYYSAISFVDYQIGRILAALGDTGRLDNTLIVFSSDHGEYLGDYNCFGKCSMHDASSRIPMIVRYPSHFPAGLRCMRPSSLIDVFPTLLKAAGIESVESDGEDLASVAAGRNSRDFVFSHYSRGGTGIHMVVSERWKYFHSLGDQKEFLFDRISDPLETQNLAGNAFRKNEKEIMKQTLLRHLLENGCSEAVIKDGEKLNWKIYPKYQIPNSEDPDSGLMIQDYPSYPMNLPGYSENRV